LRQSISPGSGWQTLGAGAGLGGQLYGLVRIGEWLEDEEFLQFKE